MLIVNEHKYEKALVNVRLFSPTERHILTYFKEEQKEVDGEGHRKSNELEIVEVPGTQTLKVDRILILTRTGDCQKDESGKHPSANNNSVMYSVYIILHYFKVLNSH